MMSCDAITEELSEDERRLLLTIHLYETEANLPEDISPLL